MGIHYVFFADDLGMASVFPVIKQRLVESGNRHISLLYMSVGKLFRKELDILQTHFPDKLLVHYHNKHSSTHVFFEQDEVEALLNANTMKEINFTVSGNASFTEGAKNMLAFLGVKKIQIQEQYFSE